jgi:hypothetical protein
VTIRYAAAGNASRVVKVNGTVVASNLGLQGTGSWSSWGTQTFQASLNAGHNTIEILYDSSLGSNNWVNIDKIYGL